MTDLIDQVAAALRSMRSTDRDSIAHAILALAIEYEDALEIDPAHLQDVIAGLAEIERGEIATDAEVEKAFRSFDP